MTKIWTEKGKAVLQTVYKTNPPEVLSKYFKATPNEIVQHAVELGIERNISKIVKYCGILVTNKTFLKQNNAIEGQFIAIPSLTNIEYDVVLNDQIIAVNLPLDSICPPERVIIIPEPRPDLSPEQRMELMNKAVSQKNTIGLEEMVDELPIEKVESIDHISDVEGLNTHTRISQGGVLCNMDNPEKEQVKTDKKKLDTHTQDTSGGVLCKTELQKVESQKIEPLIVDLEDVMGISDFETMDTKDNIVPENTVESIEKEPENSNKEPKKEPEDGNKEPKKVQTEQSTSMFQSQPNDQKVLGSQVSSGDSVGKVESPNVLLEDEIQKKNQANVPTIDNVQQKNQENQNNVLLKDEIQKKNQERNDWTLIEDTKFKELYSTTSNAKLSEVFHRSIASIKGRARVLNLRKTKKNPVGSLRNKEKKDSVDLILNDTTRIFKNVNDKEFTDALAMSKLNKERGLELVLIFNIKRFFSMYAYEQESKETLPEATRLASIILNNLIRLKTIELGLPENMQINVQKMQQVFVSGIRIMEQWMTPEEKEHYAKMMRTISERRKLNNGILPNNKNNGGQVFQEKIMETVGK